MAAESDFIVSNPRLVFSHLSEILSKKCVISAHFGENASFLTAILQLDQKTKRITLDCAPSESLNDQLLNSGNVLFRAEVDGVKASFAGRALKKVKNGDGWMFTMPLPDAIFWLQRREYFRVKVPLFHSGSHCRLTYKARNPSEQDETMVFQLADLSVSGLAFLNPLEEWDERFADDAEWPQCLLYLHAGQSAEVAFVIKDLTRVKASPTTTQLRIGCKFLYLPPGFESQLQRYIQDIELLKKNL
ncbi:MAG: flagellar brake protein [Methylomonas sp.]|nr:flagellar brake protein [Methylomonas sp.]PPD20779.1 MAG: flagellar brake protein [Methylomonas sp.]PPD27298.1 MAG: flagellar brake protein [Methylomonas sp.]PPD39269.1 MAG: flagellar brake protein [Methylomonas sp.]PPD40733.1 MAG: flagellar brake protein [Methylomonas sp.]